MHIYLLYLIYLYMWQHTYAFSPKASVIKKMHLIYLMSYLVYLIYVLYAYHKIRMGLLLLCIHHDIHTFILQYAYLFIYWSLPF